MVAAYCLILTVFRLMLWALKDLMRKESFSERRLVRDNVQLIKLDVKCDVVIYTSFRQIMLRFLPNKNNYCDDYDITCCSTLYSAHAVVHYIPRCFSVPVHFAASFNINGGNRRTVSGNSNLSLRWKRWHWSLSNNGGQTCANNHYS